MWAEALAGIHSGHQSPRPRSQPRSSLNGNKISTARHLSGERHQPEQRLSHLVPQLGCQCQGSSVKPFGAWLGLACQANRLGLQRFQAVLTQTPGPVSGPQLTPTHQSLELLLSEAHVPFGHLVVSVQGGLEDERVVRVE